MPARYMPDPAAQFIRLVLVIVGMVLTVVGWYRFATG
jgi:hypothetical protein